MKNLVICVSFRARKTTVYGEFAAHTEETFVFKGVAISGDPFLVNDGVILEPVTASKMNEGNSNENAAHSPISL